MGDKSKIEWCDATYNPITGCTPVSAGCANCYAARMVKRFPHLHESGVGPEDYPQPGDKGPMPFSKISFHPSRLDQPLRWKKPRRIFVSSMGDLFHPDVSVTWLENILATITLCPQHTFMVLTKRPERLGLLTKDRLRISRTDTWPIKNLWLGVTAENQEMADQRIPILLQTPAAKRFVSIEPMLGPVDLRNGEWASALLRLSWLHGTAPVGRVEDHRDRGLDWIICGGESGPGARPMHPDWPRSLRDQCQAASVPFFFKQWGMWAPCRAAGIYRGVQRVDYMDGVAMLRVGKKAAGCLLDGKEWKEMPEVKG